MRDSRARNENQVDKSKLDAVEIIGEYVLLRKAGRQYVGLCPFHAEKTPSFYVAAGLGFHCFGCGAKGDVIRFMQEIAGISFAEAWRCLGLGEYRPRPRDDREYRAASMLAEWLNDQYAKIGVLCRECSNGLWLARELSDQDLEASFKREWLILSDLHEDLQNLDCADELIDCRENIEAITERTSVEPPAEFPRLTPEYRAYLRELVTW
jgi:hypothetical protein